MAPATTPSGSPNALPIPTKAIPIVAAVVHELPVARETTALTTTAAKRNIPDGPNTGWTGSKGRIEG